MGSYLFGSIGGVHCVPDRLSRDRIHDKITKLGPDRESSDESDPIEPATPRLPKHLG